MVAYTRIAGHDLWEDVFKIVNYKDDDIVDVDCEKKEGKSDSILL